MSDFTVSVRWDAEKVGKRLTEDQALELDAYLRSMEETGVQLARAKVESMLAPAIAPARGSSVW